MVRGWAVTDAEALAQLDLPTGGDAVEVPAGLLAEALESWPALHQTSRGTVIVPGTVVRDSDALLQLRLAASERAVEVPACLLAKVLGPRPSVLAQELAAYTDTFTDGPRIRG